MPQLNAIGIVTSDMARSITFYRLVGLDVPETPDEGHVDTFLPNGVRFMLDSEDTVRSFRPEWTRETGNQLGLAFECESLPRRTSSTLGSRPPDSTARRLRGMHSGASAMRSSAIRTEWGSICTQASSDAEPGSVSSAGRDVVRQVLDLEALLLRLELD